MTDSVGPNVDTSLSGKGINLAGNTMHIRRHFSSKISYLVAGVQVGAVMEAGRYYLTGSNWMI